MKPFLLPEAMIRKVANEFGLEAKTVEGVSIISINADRFTPCSIEKEESHFDTFFDGATGNVFVSQPALPLPFKVTKTETGIDISIHECTEDYGIVNKRGPINLQRNLRFFVMEILEDKLHFSETPQKSHPLNN